MAETPKNALIDPRGLTFNFQDAAAKEGVLLPVPTMPSRTEEELWLGTLDALQSDDKPSDAVRELVERYHRWKSSEGKANERAMTFEQYMEWKRIPLREKRRTHDDNGYQDPLDYVKYSQDAAGYSRYLKDHHGLETSTNSAPKHLKGRDATRHTLVAGSSGAGKSELLKLMIYRAICHPARFGVLVIDPHDKLAREVARWKEFSGEHRERLVFLDAKEGKDRGGWVPTLNPLFTPPNATQDDIASMALQLGDALAELAGDNEPTTDNMRRLASDVLHVALEEKGVTLVDLVEWLSPRPQGAKLRLSHIVGRLDERAKNHPRSIIRMGFDDYELANTRLTREAIKRRLRTHLRLPSFEAAICAPDPLDLEALLSEGKVVVVNTGAFGKPTSYASGRLLLALAAAMAERRTDEGRNHPVHIFADEVTSMMTPAVSNILQNARKRKVWLTMGHDMEGESGEGAVLRKIMAHTALKFLGQMRGKQLAHLSGIEPRALPALKQGEFLVRREGEQRASLMLKAINPSPVADKNNAMSESEFDAVMAYQLDRYYRRAAAPVLALPAPDATRGQRGRGWQA